METFNVILLDRDKSRARYYQSVLNSTQFNVRWFDENTELESDFAIISDEFAPTAIPRIQYCKNLNIPVYHILDGVLEWKNQFHNPRSLGEQGIPIYLPVFSDYILCLGKSQADFLNAHNSIASAIPFGSFTFLDLIHRYHSSSYNYFLPKRIELLVVSPRTPYFNDVDQEKVLNSIVQLKNWLSKYSDLINVRWRLSEKLGGEKLDYYKRDLVTELNEVDAVISMPSTAIIESYLMRKPLAIIDFTNTPLLINSAWNINSEMSFKSFISDLFNPDSLKAKLHFQDYLLNMNLNCKNINPLKRLIEIFLGSESNLNQEYKQGITEYFNDNHLIHKEVSIRERIELEQYRKIFMIQNSSKTLNWKRKLLKILGFS